jgi:uncharacterized protein
MVVLAPVGVVPRVLAQAGATPAVAAAPSDPVLRLGPGPVRVGVIVPPSSGAFRRAAQALIDGLRVAHARDGAGIGVEIREAGESVEELVALCEAWRRAGASVVIGPLTRNAVTSLASAGAPALPVLALNQPEGVATPPRLFVFGLAIETEAAQVAAHAIAHAAAMAAGRRPRAAIVRDASPLSFRSSLAFIEAWTRLGGEHYEPVEVSSLSAELMARPLRGMQADIYFVAMPPQGAVALRQVLGERAALYATSLLNSGALPMAAGADAARVRSPELDGLRIVDMPWQVQPDHPAVMGYPRPAELNVELQKLYALGIDAWRIALNWLDGPVALELDGVTGRLRIDPSGDRRVDREPVLAEYRGGVLEPVTGRAPASPASPAATQ